MFMFILHYYHHYYIKVLHYVRPLEHILYGYAPYKYHLTDSMSDSSAELPLNRDKTNDFFYDSTDVTQIRQRTKQRKPSCPNMFCYLFVCLKNKQKQQHCLCVCVYVCVCARACACMRA